MFLLRGTVCPFRRIFRSINKRITEWKLQHVLTRVHVLTKRLLPRKFNVTHNRHKKWYKRKADLIHVETAYGRLQGQIKLVVLKYDTRWRRVASFRPRPLYPTEELPASLNGRLNGPHRQEGVEKNLYPVHESSNSYVPQSSLSYSTITLLHVILPVSESKHYHILGYSYQKLLEPSLYKFMFNVDQFTQHYAHTQT